MQCMMFPLPGVGGGSVCISPVCSLESHVTFRGHGIFGEAAGVWSEGLEFFDHKASLLCISDISWPVWGLQDIVSMRNLPWNSCGFRDDCKHMSEIYFLLPPHLLSSCLFSGTLHLLPIRFFFFLFLPSRQNPVPEESCARRGHEAAPFYRRLLQGKRVLTVNILWFPIWLWGMPPPACEVSKGHGPHCPFTCFKHEVSGSPRSKELWVWAILRHQKRLWCALTLHRLWSLHLGGLCYCSFQN